VSRRRKPLGKGLDALLPAREEGRLLEVPLDLIEPGPFQPRQSFDEDALEELAQSIRAQGMLQPLLVRPRGDGYELVAGERRYRAARRAGLDRVPAVVRVLDDKEALAAALIENLQREDLNPVEEAEGYRRLIETGLSQEEVARRVGKARSTVANALRLLTLPEPALAALRDGRISAGHARALLMLPKQKRLWGLEEILRRGLSVRQAERLKERLLRPRAGGEVHRELAERIEARLGVRARFTGRRRGRLELFYQSEEELQALLEKLGL